MRFYKPRLREYVSTQVDMPWEFLQGVAEQKQKGYDAALAQGDAANKLLNFEVNPGDMPGKQQVQKEYNDQLYKITDYIRQTGDFNTASREFSKVLRNIAQDKRIAIMTNAVEPHKEVMKSLTSLMEKGAPELGLKANPMYATYDPATGMLRPYNQRAGYDAREAHENFNKTLESAIDNVAVTQYGYTNAGNGMYKDVSGHYVSGDKLKQIIMLALPAVQSAYSTYLNDLQEDDIRKGLKPGTQMSNILNRIILERTQSSQQTKTRFTEDELERRKEKRARESQLALLAGEATPTKFSYSQYKQDIQSLDSQIKSKQAQLNDNSITELTRQKLRQEILALQSDKNRKEAIINVTEKTTADELYNEYLSSFGLSPNDNIAEAQKRIKMLNPNGKQLFTKDQFLTYMRTGKDSALNPKGDPSNPYQIVQAVTKEQKGNLDYYSSIFEEKSNKTAETGVMINEYNAVIDFNDNSVLNKSTEKIFEGMLNGSVSVTTVNGVNLTDELRDSDVDKANSSMVLVRESSTGNTTYKVKIARKDGESNEYYVDLSRSDAQLKNIIQNNAVKNMEETEDEFTMFTAASILANSAFGSELTVLRDYDVNNKVFAKPFKIGDFYIVNDKDRYGRPVPGQYIMGQTMNVNGQIVMDPSTIETNPYNPSINGLTFGDIESKLGFNVYRKKTGK